MKAASWLSSLDLPVPLIAFPEGALQGFNDEVLDLDHATFAREGAIDIPGEETEFLGAIAKKYGAFVIAQAKARHPDLKDRFFKVGFTINPRGKVILLGCRALTGWGAPAPCAQTEPRSSRLTPSCLRTAWSVPVGRSPG